MSEAIQFREVRKGERADVLAFARSHGLKAEHKALHHHLSLVALGADGQTAAAALCLEDKEGRAVIEIVSADRSPDQALVNELADRCLRKVQAERIASARLHSPAGESTNMIWEQANWLDKIAEAAPADAEPADAPVASAAPADKPSQAA